jgi:predicted transcriptional regulator
MSMCRMLLSINPQHVENILNGDKRFEFRKVRCRADVDNIVIYATSPVMQIVGEADVVEIIQDSLDVVWKITSEYAGISRHFYDEYYRGKDKAVAYRLGKVKKYHEPLQLSDFGVGFAPQSFVYI